MLAGWACVCWWCALHFGVWWLCSVIQGLSSSFGLGVPAIDLVFGFWVNGFLVLTCQLVWVCCGRSFRCFRVDICIGIFGILIWWLFGVCIFGLRICISGYLDGCDWWVCSLWVFGFDVCCLVFCVSVLITGSFLWTSIWCLMCSCCCLRFSVCCGLVQYGVSCVFVSVVFWLCGDYLFVCWLLVYSVWLTFCFE